MNEMLNCNRVGYLPSSNTPSWFVSIILAITDDKSYIPLDFILFYYFIFTFCCLLRFYFKLKWLKVITKKKELLNWQYLFSLALTFSEAATRGAPLKNVFLEILQNSQKSTSARVSFLIKLQAEISKNAFLQNTSGRLFLPFSVRLIFNLSSTSKDIFKTLPNIYDETFYENSLEH